MHQRHDWECRPGFNPRYRRKVFSMVKSDWREVHSSTFIAPGPIDFSFAGSHRFEPGPIDFHRYIERGDGKREEMESNGRGDGKQDSTLIVDFKWRHSKKNMYIKHSVLLKNVKSVLKFEMPKYIKQESNGGANL